MELIKNSISVVIPIYIGIDTLAFKSSIASLLNQTRQPDELILVMDGPIKESLWSYVRDTFSSHNFFFSVKLVCCLKNEGPGYARNLAASISSCEWLAIHDADDVYVSSRLEIQELYLSDDVDVVGAFIEELHDYDINSRINIRSVPLNDKEIKRSMNRYSPVNNATALIRKEIFIRVGGYPNLRFGEDYVLWQRIKTARGRFLNIPKVITRILVDKDFFHRRRGISLLKREFKYLSLMFHEGHIGIFSCFYKAIRSVVLRLLPLSVSRVLYRIGRK